MTHFLYWLRRILPAAAVALPLHATTILLNVRGLITSSTFSDIPAGSPFSMSMLYNPATPASLATPNQSLFPLLPGPLTGTVAGGGFQADNSQVIVATQQVRTCFQEVLNKPVSCSAFLVEADFAASDLSGTFSTDQVSHLDVFFEDDSSSLVSEFSLPTLPFPPVSAWTSIDFSAAQQQEGGKRFSGRVTALTAIETPTPESSTYLMAGLGLALILVSRAGRPVASRP